MRVHVYSKIVRACARMCERESLDTWAGVGVAAVSLPDESFRAELEPLRFREHHLARDQRAAWLVEWVSFVHGW